MPITQLFVHKILGIISGFICGSAGIPYVRTLINMRRNRIKPEQGLSPRPLSWIGWALLMSATIYSQVSSKGWEWSHSVLITSIISCTCIALLTFKNGNIKKLDVGCVLLGIFCFIFYSVTKNMWLTTLFALASDLSVGIPTIENAYRNPASEKSAGWTLGAIGYFIAICNCFETEPIYWIFPIYLCSYNSLIAYLTHRRKIAV